MDDRERVIAAIETCRACRDEGRYMQECPRISALGIHNLGCVSSRTAIDSLTLALLKGQEPVTPKRVTNDNGYRYDYCGYCGAMLPAGRANYCPVCGKKVAWDG